VASSEAERSTGRAIGTTLEGAWGRLRRPPLRVWVDGGLLFTFRAVAIVFVAEFAVHGLGPLSGFGIALVPHSRALVPSFFHWDAVRYLQIAEHGYTHQWLTVYFPLYPLLVHLGHDLGLSDTHAALLISWVSTYLLTVALIYFVRQCLGLTRWVGVVLLALWAPASFFYFSGYPESIEALLLTLVLILVFKRRLLLAAVVAGVASASAPIGVLFVLPVLVGFFQQRAEGVKWVRLLAAVVLSELGAVAYCLYLWTKFDAPLAFESAESDPQWNRKFTYPFKGVVWSLDRMVHGQLIGTPSFNGNFVVTDLIDDVVAVAATVSLVLLVYTVGRRRLAGSPLLPSLVLGIVVLVFNVCDSTAGGLSPEALARHLLIVVPIYFVVAYWRRPELTSGLLAGSVVLATVAQTLFAHNLWFT
jgi:hypothetical protein